MSPTVGEGGNTVTREDASNPSGSENKDQREIPVLGKTCITQPRKKLSLPLVHLLFRGVCVCVCVCVCVHALSYSVVTDFYNFTDYGLPAFSVQGIFQARILDWVVISYSMVIAYNGQCRIGDIRRRFSFGTRDQT